MSSEHEIFGCYVTLEEALKASLALAREGYHAVISPDNLLVNYEWVGGMVKGHFSLYECVMPNYEDGKKYSRLLPYEAVIHSLLFADRVCTTVYVDKTRKPTDISEVVQLRIKMDLTD